MIKVYVCHDNLTGLYSALYDAWLEKRCDGCAEIAFKGSVEQRLFREYTEVIESEQKAMAVQKLIQQHLGNTAYRMLYYAALSSDTEKGNAIWGTLMVARLMNKSRSVMENLTEPAVRKSFELYRQVANETHFFKEILRFKELQSGILFAQIAPKSHVLTTIAPHFDNRLPKENWMIYDETHGTFVVHEEGKQWVHVIGVEIPMEQLETLSKEEKEVEKLWKGFFHSISIRERESYDRQRQHFPIWYRKHAVEFDANS